jgi:hypothetical protein
MSVSPVPASTASRRTVKTVDSYAEAERAVDYLSDNGFPIEHVAIVGTDLRYVEQVKKRMTTWGATLAGAGYGAVFGLFWGLLFGIFFTVDSGSFLGVLLYSLVVAVVFGALCGAIAHAATRGRRDFASESATRADHYEVQVDDGRADAAEQMLAGMSATPRAA